MDDTNQGSGSGTPDRKGGGFGKYLKRFRTAIKTSSSNKAVKQNSSDVLEHTSGGRHLESAASFVTITTIRTRTPDNRTRTPEARSPSSLGRRTPSLRAPTPDVPNVPPLPENIPPVPRDARQRPPSRPSLPEPSLSEGDLLARPIREASPTDDPLIKRPDASLERSSSSLLPRSDPRDERSIALFERYGIHLEPGDWTPSNRPATMERVEKAIRMRVHYHCHRCDVAIGPSKLCVSCGHRRCKKCLKFPVRGKRHGTHDEERHRHQTPASQSADDGHPSPPKQSYETQSSWFSNSDTGESEKHDFLPGTESTSTLGTEYPPNWPLPGPDGPPTPKPIPAKTLHPFKKSSSRLALILQDIQAVHYRPADAIHVSRLCHRCNTAFIRYERVCHNCEHSLCNKCPRDPPQPLIGRQHRTPTPTSSTTISTQTLILPRRERMWKKPRRRIRWTCDHCQSLFVEKDRQCPQCGHERCDGCFREPPAQKPMKSRSRMTTPEPAIFTSIEAKLATFAIIDSGAGSKALATVTVPRTTPTPPRSRSAGSKTPTRARSPIVEAMHLIGTAE